MVEYSAGIVTAYGAAVRGGYTGTYEEFCRQQAQYADNAEAVEQAKQTAVSNAQVAYNAAQTADQANTQAQAASTAAQSASQLAGQSAQDAQTAESNASTHAQNAASAAGSAQASAAAAQAVKDSIPSDYTELSSDVTQLKADLDAKVDLPSNGYGTSGKVLRSTETGTEWAEVGQPTDEQTADAVSGWLDEHPEATTTVQDESLTESKFSNALKLSAIKDYVTPQMFGAVGDGIADDTAAFLQACASGSIIFVSGCKIGNASVSGKRIISDGMILSGKLSVNNTELTGNITVNGGSIEVNGDGSSYRDDTNIHDCRFVIQSCQNLLTLTGTLYNVRFCKNTVVGRCSSHVIYFETNTWITYTYIIDNFLGTCYEPIAMNATNSSNSGIAGIRIINTFAQKTGNGVAKFLRTNCTGNVFLINSFMYDISSDGDTQVYIERTEGNASRKFNIVMQGGPSVDNVQESIFAMDSNGREGIDLFGEVTQVLYQQNAYSVMPIPNTHNRGFAVNPTGYAGYGYGFFSQYGSPIRYGITTKFGTANTSKSDEAFIGCATPNGISGAKVLMMGYRTSDDTTWQNFTYIPKEQNAYVSSKAEIDAYGSGHPLFHKNLKKIVIKYGLKYYDAMGTDITSQIT